MTGPHVMVPKVEGSGAKRGEPQVGGRVVSWVRAASWESRVAVVET